MNFWDIVHPVPWVVKGVTNHRLSRWLVTPFYLDLEDSHVGTDQC